MPETRRPSTRLKSERQSKRRTSTPPPAPPPKSRKRSPTPIEVDEPLPSSIKDGQFLPTCKEPQATANSHTELKSISDSGVLSASLEQSRQRWLMEGLFEKYWVKGTKKNPAPANQPGRETMNKLGLCSLIIEPHQFEVTLYSIKNTVSAAQTGDVVWQQPQVPKYPPPAPMVYGSPYGGAYQPPVAPIGPPPPHSQQQPSPLQGHIPAQPTFGTPLAPAHKEQLKPTLPPPSTTLSPAPVPEQNASVTASTPQPTDPIPPANNEFVGSQATPQPMPGQSTEQAPVRKQPDTPGQQPSGAPAPAPAPREDSSGADPVIQMLAARAAEDSNLKALMKVVAQGNANQEQLSIFQKHIDELNQIINERKKKTDTGVTNMPAPAVHNPSPRVSSPVSRPSVPAPIMTPAPHPRQIHPATMTKQEPIAPYHYPQQFTKPKPPIAPKFDISGIVFEFTSAPNTRYLLPRNSIVEYVNETSPYILVSFLMIRKGSTAFGGKYKEDKEYYQPVTLKLRSTIQKFWELVTRAVAPAEEVKKEMTEAMERLEIAEDIYLATRLPRAEGEELKTSRGDGKISVAENVASQKHNDYGAPNSILPMHT